jgi:hypothetical protein
MADELVQIAKDVGYICGKVDGIETDVSEIKTRLETGDREFGELNQKMSDHCDNPSAHHSHPKVVVKKSPGQPSKVKEYKWQLIIIIATTISGVLLAVFATNGG